MATTEWDVLLERREEEEYAMLRMAIREELALAAKVGPMRLNGLSRNRTKKQGGSNARRRQKASRNSATMKTESSSSSPSSGLSAARPQVLSYLPLGGVR